MAKLYSYVVARDYGFAPNPFGPACTLATCKPVIRRTAQVGDWIVGTGSAANGRAGHVVFVMRVGETCTFDQYWKDPRFEIKKPNLRASRKLAYGDNIYHRASGKFVQENSHHSYADGRPNPHNIANDTQTDRVLIGSEFIYWGGGGPKLPARFRGTGGPNLCGRRGHKTFETAITNDFVTWVRSLGLSGVQARPRDWEGR